MDHMSYAEWDNRFRHWLMHGTTPPEGKLPEHGRHLTQPWWKVMCLTGVDYFSTLGYQPGIAFLAAGAISPIATIVLVALTLFGALPIYRRVARESPHGQGSILMLERLLTRWKGKLFVLALLGFVATDFVITITLSAADATAHIIENPFVKLHFPYAEHPLIITLILVIMLGIVFLRGFKEAVNIAVVLVTVYLLLNAIVIGVSVFEILKRPELLLQWQDAVANAAGTAGFSAREILAVAVISLVVFPKLALGLSGFETGVAVMPLVKKPNRIGNTHKLLLSAALIMSFFLIASSFVTSVIIPAAEFERGGEANGRALAFIAHEYLGEIFGSIYDLSTILILWFAGASAMAGLLNIVPRYLPRYGMAPDWARAIRPLVLVFVAICLAVTIWFNADVDAQGGAYATGVLVLMTSAAIAVTISSWRGRERKRWAYLSIAIVFVYTTGVNVIQRPDGIKIASIFILTIIATSFLSRIKRSMEVRIRKIELDDAAKEILSSAGRGGEIRIVTHRRETGIPEEYAFKESEKRLDNHIPKSDPIVFFEVDAGDASEFSGTLTVRGLYLDGYKILRTESPAIPNAIAAFLLFVQKSYKKAPHVYFGWSEGNPFRYLIRFVVFGEGDTAPVTREILRKAEPDPEKRPHVHVGG